MWIGSSLMGLGIGAMGVLGPAITTELFGLKNIPQFLVLSICQ